MRTPSLLLSALAALIVTTVAFAAPIERTVGDRFQISVSWINEPAILGDTNGVRLTITENGEPVTEKVPDIQIEAQYMDAVRVLNLMENEPGVYTGVFIPMQPGDYSFRISGTIDGVQIDETFATADGITPVQPRLDYEFPNAAHGFEPVKLAVPIAATTVLAALWWNRMKRR